MTTIEKITVKLKPREKLSKINKIRGDFSEYLAWKHYRRLGYHVIKLVYRKPMSGWLSDYWKYVLNIDEIDNVEMDKQYGELANYLLRCEVKGLPDFLCIHPNESMDRFFVECKCDPKKLNDSQKLVFSQLNSMGYPVYIFSVKIKEMNIEHNEISIMRFE